MVVVSEGPVETEKPLGSVEAEPAVSLKGHCKDVANETVAIDVVGEYD